MIAAALQPQLTVLSHKPWKGWLALSRFWSEIDWQFSDPRIVTVDSSSFFLVMCRCDFCCCPHQTYLQIFHNKGISRRLLNIHSLPATLSPGKRWKEMSLLDEYRNSQGHSGTQQQNSAKQPLPMSAKPRSRWGFRWPWIESIIKWRKVFKIGLQSVVQ